MSRLIVSPLVKSGLLRPKGIKPAVEAGGLSLNGSITFNGSDEYLSIASFSSSSPNQRKFTIAYWTKVDNLSNTSFPAFFSTGKNTAYFDIYWNDGVGSLVVDKNGEIESTTDVLSNDTWHHICVSVDIDEESGEEIKIYVDGIAEDSGSSIGEDDTFMFENGEAVSICFSVVFENGHLDGRIADFIVVEGQALAPTDVNYDSAGGGKWKDYTGSFGDHGFRINPQDNSEIGTDQSGNGNHFALNNMGTGNFDSGDTPPI